MTTKWDVFPLKMLEMSEQQQESYSRFAAETHLEFRKLLMGQWEPSPKETEDGIADSMERTIEAALAREAQRVQFEKMMHAKITIIDVQVPSRYLFR